MDFNREERMNENQFYLKDQPYLQYPKKLASEQEMYDSGSPRIEPISKLVYLFLVYEKSKRGDMFTPTYDHMLNTYGISTNNYASALAELDNLGYIKREIVPFRNATRVQVTIVSGTKAQKWSAIPISIILTDVYNNNQKIFIITIFSLFLYDFKKALNSVCVTKKEITKRVASLGIKSSFVYKTMDELSLKDSGYVNLFYRDGSKTRYLLDFNAWNLITNRVLLKPHSEANSKYIKPKKGMFTISGDESEGYYIAENENMISKAKAAKEKDYGLDDDDTFDEMPYYHEGNLEEEIFKNKKS